MLTGTQNIASNLKRLRLRIAAAAGAAGRDAAEIKLIGVTKGHPADVVRAAVAAGLGDFGENFVQEAVAKIAAAGEPRVAWHFIGALQSNKTREVAAHFDWVHTVDRPKIARRLAGHRPPHAPPLQVCLQVHIGGEPGKSGAAAADLPALAAAVAALPRLALRGLMCVPPEETDPARQRRWFAELRHHRDALAALGHRLDVLSMGMSGDFEQAIAEGATHVRVGTALFGPRG